ncbi:unnamed protein product, partial [Mesorhabditis belari]|uniref:Potassium channel tetramerisation-type BTB domain-containing protein n=1 Tax=Mesorhabditis belari TaxID=2138241 RepID=A0AAF3EMH1_9BILA
MKIKKPWRRRNSEGSLTSKPKPPVENLDALEKGIEPEIVVMTIEPKPRLVFKKDDVIRLNVGGQRFDTFLSTLLVDRSNELFSHFVVLLEADLTEEKMPIRDNEGAFFLDRDPDQFRILLNNLRYVSYLRERQKLGKSSESLAFDDENKHKSGGLFGRFRKGN